MRKVNVYKTLRDSDVWSSFFCWGECDTLKVTYLFYAFDYLILFMHVMSVYDFVFDCYMNAGLMT